MYKATDMEIQAKLLLHTKSVLNMYLADFCGQPLDKVRDDTERDFFMTAAEAKKYGLIDSVIPHKMMPSYSISGKDDLFVRPPTGLYDTGFITRSDGR
jgi:ATP-dependent protease ClpP protease subunit